MTNALGEVTTSGGRVTSRGRLPKSTSCALGRGHRGHVAISKKANHSSRATRGIGISPGNCALREGTSYATAQPAELSEQERKAPHARGRQGQASQIAIRLGTRGHVARNRKQQTNPRLIKRREVGAALENGLYRTE